MCLLAADGGADVGLGGGLRFVGDAEVGAAFVVRFAADEAAVALVADLELGAAGAVVFAGDLAGVDLGIVVGGQALGEACVFAAAHYGRGVLAAAVGHFGGHDTIAVALAAGFDAVAGLAAVE